MLHFCIVDDSLQDEQEVERLIKDNMGLEPYSLAYFSNGFDFLEKSKTNYDLIFLDIEMPQMNGMEIAQKIRAKGNDAIIIFETKVAKFAAKGYEVDAVGYLLKPINPLDFSLIFNKAIKILKKRIGRYLLLKSDEGKTIVSSNDIVYVEVIDHQILVHKKNKEVITCWSSLKEFKEKLVGLPFYETNRFFLINLAYVTSFKSDSITVDGKEFTLSRLKKENFMLALNKYLGEII